MKLLLTIPDLEGRERVAVAVHSGLMHQSAKLDMCYD